jgi:hypothetical protein
MNLQKHIRKVINEIRLSSETLSKNPIKYYFVNFLDQKKIHFDGLYLHPLFLDDFIKWTVENPNDYSYNNWVIKDELENEFKFFCNMTNVNYERYHYRSSVVSEIPNNCYVSENDKMVIDEAGKRIKKIMFKAQDNSYEFDFNYERFRVHTTYGSVVDFDVFGYITNLKITENQSGYEWDANPKTFISEMSEYDYGLWRDEQYDILTPMFNVLNSNRRFYNNQYDYVDLTMIPL